MTKLLVDETGNCALPDGVARALLASDLETIGWDGARLRASNNAEAIITTPARIAEVRQNISSVAELRIAVLVDCPTVDETRSAIREGAHGVIDVSKAPRTQVLAAVAVAGGLGVHPAGHSLEIATRLGSPPRILTSEEVELLRVSATRSNEAAGKALGYSRRQTQRRLRTIYDDLGFDDHYEAAISAVRWGLLESGDT